MNRSIASTLVLAAMAAIALPHAASADQKSYHASQCMAADGIETDYSRSEYRITRTGTDGSGTLLCPVVRDVWDCSGVFGCVIGSEARVKVYDLDLDSDVVCTFSSRSETGNTVYYSSDKSYNAPGHDTLVMGGGFPSGDGTYALKCTMGANHGSSYSKIHGYTVNELD